MGSRPLSLEDEVANARSHLARLLNRYSAHLAEQGLISQAVAVSTEAVDMSRKLHDRDASRYAAELASALSVMGARLHEVGRRKEALAAARESLALIAASNEVTQSDADALWTVPDLVDTWS